MLARIRGQRMLDSKMRLILILAGSLVCGIDLLGQYRQESSVSAGAVTGFKMRSGRLAPPGFHASLTHVEPDWLGEESGAGINSGRGR